jgi:predicted helicase
VAFTSPWRSVVDIVQAAGRGMRRGGDKAMGYILVPIVVPDDMDVVEFANTTPFKEVVRIIRAMALADPRIVDELRAVYEGRIASGRLFKFKIDERIGAEVALYAFAAAITTRVWEVVARYNGMYRSFADARAFARGLGLKNMHESTVGDWKERQV